MKLLPIIFILFVVSCNSKSKSALDISKEFGDTLNLPKDSLAFYFPKNSFDDRSSVDSFRQNWYSSALYSFKEPVLSKDYVGHNIHRFLWLRSFHRPVVFTLHQGKDR